LLIIPVIIKRSAFAGKRNIIQTRASLLTINNIMNAINDRIPPAFSYFQASANPKSPKPNKLNCIKAFKVNGTGFVL
jgi:hypothetical protein